MSSQNSVKPTTSKRSLNDVEDEENEPQDSGYSMKGSNKRKSSTDLGQSSATQGTSLTKKQKSLMEINEQKREILENAHRPLFFKPKFKTPDMVASQIVRKGLKVADFRPSWGVLEFYAENKLVNSIVLTSFDPITVTSRELLNKTTEENVSNYTDLDHALGNGFLIHRSIGQKSIISMSCVCKNNCNDTKFKVFNGPREYFIQTDEMRVVYDGNETMKSLEKVSDVRSAYEFANSCCLQIGVVGKYLSGLGFYQSMPQALERDLLTSMPYWLLLKVQPDFQDLDKHLLRTLKFV